MKGHPAGERKAAAGPAHAGLQHHYREGAGFFADAGLTAQDAGGWLREQCFILAKNNRGTSVFEWLAQPLRELTEWIKVNNQLIEKEEQRPEEAREQLRHRGRKFGRGRQ